MTNQPSSTQPPAFPSSPSCLLPRAPCLLHPAPCAPCTMFEPQKKSFPWYTVHGTMKRGEFTAERRSTLAPTLPRNLNPYLANRTSPQPPAAPVFEVIDTQENKYQYRASGACSPSPIFRSLPGQEHQCLDINELTEWRMPCIMRSGPFVPREL
jgi:hypothetical protein